MKKKLFLALLIATLGGSMLRGQAALLVLIFGDKVASENFYFSLKMGATLADLSGYDEGKNALAFNFGLVNNIKLSDRLFLTPEFLPAASRGIKDVPTLSTGDPGLDQLLIDPDKSNRKLNFSRRDAETQGKA